MFNTQSSLDEKLNLKKLDQDIYYDCKCIGSGGFADVYKGIIKSKRKFVAIKRIKISSQKIEENLQNEIDIMKSISHKNLIKFYNYICHQDVGGGTLRQEITKNKKLPEELCLKYLKEIVDGIWSLHNSKFIHRDLKPQNILLTQNYDIKICDFGISKGLRGQHIDVVTQLTKGIGTLHYMAPQVHNSEYSSKCDVWSISIILYQMCTGVNPFAKNYFDEMVSVKNQQRKQLEGDYNDFFKQIIRSTFVYDQNLRINIFQLKQLVDKFYNQYMNFQSNSLRSKGSISIQQPKKKFRLVSEQNFVRQPTQANQQQFNYHHLFAVAFNKTIQQVQNDLAHQEESSSNLVTLNLFIGFVTQRSYQFVTISDEIRSSNYWPIDKLEKYIIFTIGIFIYYKSLEQACSLLCTNKIQLPGINLIDVQKMHSVVKYQLKKYIQNHLKTINQHKETFHKNLCLIYRKLTTEPAYLQDVTDPNFKYKQVLQQLELIATGKNLSKSRQEFQFLFEKVFKFYQAPSVKQLMNCNEYFLRMYWGVLKLCDVGNQFPISNFQNKSILAQFRQDYHKKPKQNKIAQIIKIRCQAERKRLSKMANLSF